LTYEQLKKQEIKYTKDKQEALEDGYTEDQAVQYAEQEKQLS